MRQGRASGDVPQLSPFVWPPFLSPPPLRLDHFWKLARKSRRISRIGPASTFSGFIDARATGQCKLLLFLGCHVPADGHARAAPRVPRCFGNASRATVKVYGLFGIRSGCTPDPAPMTPPHSQQPLAQPGSAKSRSIDPPRSNESRV